MFPGQRAYLLGLLIALGAFSILAQNVDPNAKADILLQRAADAIVAGDTELADLNMARFLGEITGNPLVTRTVDDLLPLLNGFRNVNPGRSIVGDLNANYRDWIVRQSRLLFYDPYPTCAPSPCLEPQVYGNRWNVYPAIANSGPGFGPARDRLYGADLFVTAFVDGVTFENSGQYAVVPLSSGAHMAGLSTGYVDANVGLHYGDISIGLPGYWIFNFWNMSFTDIDGDFYPELFVRYDFLAGNAAHEELSVYEFSHGGPLLVRRFTGSYGGYARQVSNTRVEVGVGSPGGGPLCTEQWDYTVGSYYLTQTTCPPIAVPNVVGMTQTDAALTLAIARLAVGMVNTASSLTVPAGSVISEDPPAGTLVNSGSAVDLVISSGPPRVTVTSSPSGAAFTVSGVGCAAGMYTTPVILGWNMNTNCTVTFANPQIISGSSYVFSTSTINGNFASVFNPRVVFSGTGPVAIDAAFFGPPVVGTIGVSPSSGTGSVQTFTSTFVAAGGYQNLQWVEMLFALASDGGGQPFCYVHYDVQGNKFWLYSDVLGFFLGPIAPGAPSNLLQGSSCALNTSASSAVGSGVGLTVTVSMVFKQPLVRLIFLRAHTLAGVDTGWIQRGIWTMAAASLGTMTVVPSSGSVTNGTERTFTLTYPDTPGFAGAAFGWEQFLVAVASDGGGQPFCYVHYDRGGNGLWMYSSDVGFFVGPVTPGTSSPLLTSSACTVNAASATVQNTGGNLVLSVPVTLKAPMSGSQKLFERSLTVLNVDTGFLQTGTFTVN